MKNGQKLNLWCDSIIFFGWEISKEIDERVTPTLGDLCSSHETVRLWVNEFKRSRTSIEDKSRSRSSKSAVMSENIDKVHNIVLANRRVEVRELIETVGISIYRTHFILYNELNMK